MDKVVVDNYLDKQMYFYDHRHFIDDENVEEM